MTLISAPVQESSQSATISIQPELIHTLIYRGASYLTSLQRINNTDRQEARLKELVGKRLSYRGMTYEITPSLGIQTKLPTTFKQLVYRGMSYMKAV